MEEFLLFCFVEYLSLGEEEEELDWIGSRNIWEDIWVPLHLHYNVSMTMSYIYIYIYSNMGKEFGKREGILLMHMHVHKPQLKILQLFFFSKLKIN